MRTIITLAAVAAAALTAGLAPAGAASAATARRQNPCGAPFRAPGHPGYELSLYDVARTSGSTVHQLLARNLHCMGGSFYRFLGAYVDAGDWHADLRPGTRFWGL